MIMDDDQSSAFLPEEIIVAEILLRLHVKALFKFKCVSKRYESIISDPKFALKYLEWAYSSPESSCSSGLLASLLFPFTHWSRYRDGFTENVKDLSHSIDSSSGQYPDDEDQPSIYVSTVSLSCDSDHAEHEHEILGSSGGLIVSLIRPYLEVRYIFALCVSNPLTKQCVQLPDSTKMDCLDLVFGFATRWDQASSLLTYKVVSIERAFGYGRYVKNTVEVFSSDTGSWVAREVSCPKVLHKEETPTTGFCYKGILHWFDRRKGTIITYDPYDNPDRFGRIRLPKQGRYSFPASKNNKHNKSLIYSGSQEMLKYCEIVKCESESGVDRLFLWKLVDYDMGEWCLEGEFSVPSLPYLCRRLMVAPYPWNRNLICHPFLRCNMIAVINPRAGTRKLVTITGLDVVRYNTIMYLRQNTYDHKFLPTELCPWSSPFYASPF